MKLAIIYHSETGNTKKAAEFVLAGMLRVDGIEAKLFSVDSVDEEYVKESKGVVFGAPTYYADTSWQMMKFFHQSSLPLKDKLGGAFSTANSEQGGSEIVLEGVCVYMLAKGMLCYSGGTTHGMPMSHLGANAFARGGGIEARADLLSAFGERFARKAVELF